MWTNRFDPVMTCQPPRRAAARPHPGASTRRTAMSPSLSRRRCRRGYGEYRVIPPTTASTIPPGRSRRRYFGDTVGRWEGDTLVLDSISFVDTTWLGRGGFSIPPTARRGTVHAPGRTSYLYDVTVEDPQVQVEPWVIRHACCGGTPVETRVVACASAVTARSTSWRTSARRSGTDGRPWALG